MTQAAPIAVGGFTQSAAAGACAFVVPPAGKSAFRAKKWASRYEGPSPLRSAQNNAVASMACNGHLQDRASGIRGPRPVVSSELFASFTWCPVVSGDGVRAEVARLGNGATP